MGNNQFKPLVSIIIPVYNGSNYMREAIDSALAQTYTNTEVLVINDGSCDNGATEAIAREYGDKIRYFYIENGGVSTALNTGIRNMTGDYFSWLSHDDVYTPDKVEKSVEALSKIEDKHTLVCCACMHIDKDSKPLKGNRIRKTKKREETTLCSWGESLMQILVHGTMNGCALLIHKEIFEKVGLFDETLRFNQDSFMWNKIFLKGYGMLCIPDVCVKGRIHAKQLTQTGQSIFRKDCEKMSKFLIPELVSISTKKINYLLAYIKYHAKYGNAKVVDIACVYAKRNELISLKDAIDIFAWRVYGNVRPLLRKVYYKVVRGIRIS